MFYPAGKRCVWQQRPKPSGDSKRNWERIFIIVVQKQIMIPQRYNGKLVRNGIATEVADCLATEIPLSIAVNYEPFTVTMCTPGKEIELARGLLFTEGIYRDVNKYFGISFARQDEGLLVNVELPKDKILKQFSGSRNVASVSSCGMCGKTEFECTTTAIDVTTKPVLEWFVIEQMFTAMRQHQQAFDESGGTHAAAAFTSNGELLDVQEDIGRHNAVDKVIGSLLLQNALHKAACLTVSGRISYEIVNKVLVAGIPFLASVSAPSTMAVDIAQRSGLTLLAFCRGDKFTAYTYPESIGSKVQETETVS